MLECVINVSEGRDDAVIGGLRRVAGRSLLDLHRDRGHNRTVLTLAGPDVESAARAVTGAGVATIDLGAHAGAHPRMGAVDVAPFVPLEGAAMADAVAARDRFASWVANQLGVPCFLYGPERSLPDVRRDAFRSLAPDVGPPVGHPTAGAICAGARPVLVAYNVRLAPGTPVELAREIASAVRGPAVRALGLDLGGGLVQVSMNLLDWRTVGPAEAYDAVVALAGAGAGAVGARGVGVSGAEVVGLVPEEALVRVPEWRWAELGLSGGRTIEAAVRRAGFG